MRKTLQSVIDRLEATATIAHSFRARLRRRSVLSLPNVLIGIALLCGLALRSFWSLTRQASGASGEAFNVARAIAQGRGFADAYMPGQGPTAHLMPISPMVAGAAYRWFGVHNPIAELLLFVWSSVLVFGAFLLLLRAFRRLGTPLWARIAAVSFLCLSPAYVAQEAVDFRIWEGGLASFLGALFLDTLLVMSDDGEATRPRLALLAIVAALLFFVNPPLGLGALACALVFGLTHLSRSKLLFASAVTAGAVAVLIVPWSIRNEAELSAFVPLRSDTGLELALANHPGAVSSKDPGRAFAERLGAIHPAESQRAFAAMQSAGGEVPYSRMLGRSAKDWIAAHPGAATQLALQHVKQIFAPEPWQFSLFGTGKFTAMRALFASLAGVGGLLGLLVALSRKRRGWIYPALFVLLPALSLAIFQPVPRYTYLFYPVLAFCAADLLASLVAPVRRLTRG